MTGAWGQTPRVVSQPHHPRQEVEDTTRGVFPHTPVNHMVFSWYHVVHPVRVLQVSYGANCHGSPSIMCCILSWFSKYHVVHPVMVFYLSCCGSYHGSILAWLLQIPCQPCVLITAWQSSTCLCNSLSASITVKRPMVMLAPLQTGQHPWGPLRGSFMNGHLFYDTRRWFTQMQ